jgi:hypothetical protein
MPGFGVMLLGMIAIVVIVIISIPPLILLCTRWRRSLVAWLVALLPALFVAGLLLRSEVQRFQENQLVHACAEGKYDEVRQMLDSGVSPDARESRAPPKKVLLSGS